MILIGSVRDQIIAVYAVDRNAETGTVWLQDLVEWRVSIKAANSKAVAVSYTHLDVYKRQHLHFTHHNTVRSKLCCCYVVSYTYTAHTIILYAVNCAVVTSYLTLTLHTP